MTGDARAFPLIADEDCPGSFEMDRLCVIVDSAIRAQAMRAALQGFFDASFFQLHEIPESAPEQFTLVDVDLRDPTHCVDLKKWLKGRPRSGQAIFCVRRDSHAQVVQAYALGATTLLARPASGEAVRTKFAERQKSREATFHFSFEASPGIAAGVSILQDIFETAMSGGALDVDSIGTAGEAVVSNIEEDGLASWIDMVRKHHSQTFQHCLLVTGVAVGFARHLGFSSADRQRIAAAGLLHDVGKARIPVTILEKPGPLDDAELAVMRQHTLLGLEVLETSPGLQPEMIDMVAHHHEYLDGSGYPHGLEGNSISDLVRTITIADIFGALLERRSYKPPMDGSSAYAILQGMGGKLDRDLVREFRAVAKA
jgi:putative nucleotidyltransferase with HDIG domain